MHKERLKYGEYYAEQKTQLYTVLKRSTDKVMSRGKVKKYEDTRDSAMAYAYLEDTTTKRET